MGNAKKGKEKKAFMKKDYGYKVLNLLV